MQNVVGENMVILSKNMSFKTKMSYIEMAVSLKLVIEDTWPVLLKILSECDNINKIDV